MDNWGKYGFIGAASLIISVGMFAILGKVFEPGNAYIDASTHKTPNMASNTVQPLTDQVAPKTPDRFHALIELFKVSHDEFFTPAPKKNLVICRYPGLESPFKDLNYTPPRKPDLTTSVFSNIEVSPVQFKSSIAGVNPRRYSPELPPSVTKSGHCYVSYFVNTEFRAENIEVTNCTEPLFEEPTYKAISNNTHPPYFPEPEFVGRQITNEKYTFRILDENGNIIPE